MNDIERWDERDTLYKASKLKIKEVLHFTNKIMIKKTWKNMNAIREYIDHMRIHSEYIDHRIHMYKNILAFKYVQKYRCNNLIFIADKESKSMRISRTTKKTNLWKAIKEKSK